MAPTETMMQLVREETFRWLANRDSLLKEVIHQTSCEIAPLIAEQIMAAIEGMLQPTPNSDLIVYAISTLIECSEWILNQEEENPQFATVLCSPNELVEKCRLAIAKMQKLLE